MADTEFLTGAAETMKRWAKEVWREAPELIYWGKFMGKDMNSVIQVKEDLEGQPGDELTFTLLRKLQGAGVTGDNTLEGSEEQMVHYSDSIVLDQRRNAIRLKGKLSERRTAFDQRTNAKDILKTWLAETIDDDIFTGFDSSPTSVVFGGDATSTATIDSGDTITLAKVDTAVARAKKATPKIWPVRVEGRDYYVVCMHTDVEYDLRQSTAWADHHQEAGPRDYGKNALFAGGLGVYGGAVLHSHVKIPIASTWGAGGNETGASNFFLGRQAGLFGWGSRPEWWEKEFDYNNKVGFAIGAIWDFTKAVFNAADHGFIAIRTYRTNN
jgi:N4-gp56 family major capsid protein